MAKPIAQLLRVEDLDHVTVVRIIEPEIRDYREAELAGEKLFGVVDSGRCELVLHLKEVSYLWDVLIGKMIALQKKVEHADGWLVLCEPQPDVFENLQVKKLTEYFNIADHEALALLQFGVFPAGS